MQPLKIDLVGYLFGKYPELTCGSSRLKFQWNWDTPGRFTWKIKENNPEKVNVLKLLTKENLLQSGFFDHQNYVEKSK